MTETDQPAAPRPQSVARNTAFALLVQVTTTAFTAVTTLYLVRALGPQGYGTFALAFALTGIAGLVARLGIPQSLARFIADHRSDPVMCAALIRDALQLTIVSATLTAGGLFVSAGWIADQFGESDLVWPLRAMAISLAAETVIALFLGVFIALARIASNLRIVFIESIVEASASIALVAVGTGATGAAFGRAIGYSVGAALAGVMVFRLFRGVSRTVRGHRVASRKGEIVRYAVPLFVLDSIFGLYARVNVVLIGGLLNTASVGQFSAATRLLSPIEGLGIAVANSVSPRQAPSEQGRFIGAFTGALRWLTILHAALIAPLLIWAEPIVSLLFGPDYDDSAQALVLLTPYIFLNGITTLVSTTANYLGLARQRIPIALGALAITTVIGITLLPRIGIAAAAIGSSAAYCLYTPAHLFLCRRHLEFSLSPYVRTVVRSLIATGAFCIVLALAARGGLSLGTAALGLAFGSAAFLGTLLATREIRLAECTSALRIVRARTSRQRTGS